MTSSQWPVYQQLTSGVQQTPCHPVKGHKTYLYNMLLDSVSVLLIYFYCVMYFSVTVSILRILKCCSTPHQENRCHITPIPPHESQLSITVTLICPQGLNVEQ